MRPGEKLVEELSRAEEVTLSTAHERISVFAGANPAWSELAPGIESLRALCRSRDEQGLLRKIMELVPEYHPDARQLEKVRPDAGHEARSHWRQEEHLRRLVANLGSSVLAFEPRAGAAHEA